MLLHALPAVLHKVVEAWVFNAPPGVHVILYVLPDVDDGCADVKVEVMIARFFVPV